MKTIITKRIGLLGTFGLFALGTLSGCGKDDDNAPSNAKSTFKFTIAVTGVNDETDVAFQVNAANHDASQYGSPVWKFNNVQQGNEHIIMLNGTYFSGSTKTYVCETVKPFNFASLNVTVFNHDGSPLTVSYKAEVDGKVETNEQNLVFNAGAPSYSKNFTYTAK
jgi:hypothetical protein